MFKKVEVLDKAKYKNINFDDVDGQEVAKHIHSLPLGFNEVIDMSLFCPVVISGNVDNMEFVAFSGISSAVTIFNKEGQYIPFYVRTYPFLNAVLIDKNGKIQDVIGVDNSVYLGKKKANNIFKKDGELDTLASAKIKQIHELNRQRDISKKIIKEFIKYDLLIKKDFKVNYGEDSKVILDNFYIVNREKLIKLDDDILALWAKKGWITLIDMHIKSLNNFEKVVFSNNK